MWKWLCFLLKITSITNILILTKSIEELSIIRLSVCARIVHETVCGFTWLLLLYIFNCKSWLEHTLCGNNSFQSNAWPPVFGSSKHKNPLTAIIIETKTIELRLVDKISIKRLKNECVKIANFTLTEQHCRK